MSHLSYSYNAVLYVACLYVASILVVVDAAPVVNETCKIQRHGSVHLISGGDVRVWTDSIKHNHEEYARHHGYTYTFVEGNAASPRKPYWSKVKLLLDELSNPQHPSQEWLLWVDDDIVFTDLTSDMLERWQTEMDRNDKQVSVTEDAAAFTVLNTGMILVRRSTPALQLVKDLWSFGAGFLSNCPQSRCLHEQQALRNLYTFGRTGGDPEFYSNILLVIEQRRGTFNTNTFRRETHFDACRQQHQDYDSDQLESRWQNRDFTCHVTGMNVHVRAQLLTECLEHAHGVGNFPTLRALSEDPCGAGLVA